MVGIAFPIMISVGVNGVTSNWSNVPFSRSRATESADSINVWIMLSEAIRPGKIFQRVSRLGLYHARDSTVSGGPALPPLRHVEGFNDCADITRGGAGGIGVARVEDQLHRGRFACVQLLARSAARSESRAALARNRLHVRSRTAFAA